VKKGGKKKGKKRAHDDGRAHEDEDDEDSDGGSIGEMEAEEEQEQEEEDTSGEEEGENEEEKGFEELEGKGQKEEKARKEEGGKGVGKQQWVQCDNCSKWRKLETGAPEWVDTYFVCMMNGWDPPHRYGAAGTVMLLCNGLQLGYAVLYKIIYKSYVALQAHFKTLYTNLMYQKYLTAPSLDPQRVRGG
jgi:hypothetical protein